MTFYEVKMYHTEKSFQALAHMQYDLFCQKNRFLRTVLSVVLMAAGVVNSSEWWGIVLIACGCYMVTGTYNAANHTAHKLVKQVQESGMDFPASKYVFRANTMDVFALPEGTSLRTPLNYRDICRMGEDANYFYIFRDQYGGYMIPKKELGQKVDAFRTFMKTKAGQDFRSRTAPVLRLMRKLQEKKSEPRHL